MTGRDKGARLHEGTRPRQVRVSDGLWEAAQNKAESEGTTVAEAVRAFLSKWTGYSGPAVHGREPKNKEE